MGEMADHIFNQAVDGAEKLYSFDEFMEIMLRLRGSNKATVKDIIDLKRYFNAAFDSIDKLGNDMRRLRTEVQVNSQVIAANREIIAENKETIERNKETINAIAGSVSVRSLHA